MPGIQIISITEEQYEAYQQLLTFKNSSRPHRFSVNNQECKWTELTIASFTLGYLKEGRLCAALTFTAINDPGKLSPAGEFSDIYIPKSAHIPTAGRRLLTTALRTVQERFPEIRRISLRVATHKEAFIRLYIKFGFERDATTPDTYAADEDKLTEDTMLLSLSNNDYENTLSATGSL